MLLEITTTRSPATDLGYILHKNPANVRSVSLGFGRAHVFYPEASEERCTASLLLEVDPIGLVRGRRREKGQARTLDHYVNDRPYAASSHMSVALSRVYGTALSGKCSTHPALVDEQMPLTARIAAIPCRGGVGLLRDLFEPLGYEVEAQGTLLDDTFVSWGESPYFTVSLSGTTEVRTLLSHLYVLIPVLDNEKHYWIDSAEIEKLLRRGEGWLSNHPKKELIVNRYLGRRRRFTMEALAQLLDSEDDASEEVAASKDAEEEEVEKPISLNQHRIDTVLGVVRNADPGTLIDLGCGEGKYLREYLKERNIRRVVGVDVSHRALEKASARLRLDRMPETQRERIDLIHGSLMYRDRRFADFDVATCVEVIEHLDPPRLQAFGRVLFEFARPKLVVVTTPNAEFNVRFETLPAGAFRHRDHRFEWTRQEFETWAREIAAAHGYDVEFHGIGQDDPEVGSPTQMAVFSK